MTVTWDTFFRYIQPHVPGCPEITIEQHLQEAATDFCERSYVWQVDIEEDFTAKTLADYEVFVPNGAALEDVLVLYLGGTPLNKVADRHFHMPASAPLGRPHSYSIFQDRSVRFYPVPDGKYTFSGAAILKPTLDAPGVEDFIYATHGRAIASGALSRLMIIPAKEWTNPELATYHQTRFARAADEARRRDTSRGGVRIAARGFDRPTPSRGF